MDDGLASAIAATQEQLGGLFQKPKLSEKLLSKAPFRFLHDIVTAVTASTGFAAGLYSGDELDSAAIKDKAAKISFLDKLVALVGVSSGRHINVRPSKVVAGLEPEGTNELLAALGKCARSTELDFDEAVRRALSGETPGQNPPPLRTAASAVSGDDSNGRHPTQDDRESSSTGKGGGVDRRGSAEERQRRGSEAAEAKSEEKQGGARGGARRDSGDGKRRGSDEGPRGSDTGGGNSGDGGDDKATTKQEIEQMGAAAKAMGAPQSRRLSSRAGATRAESKSENLATSGLGDDQGGMGGRDLTGAIEACTGDIAVTRSMLEPIISRPRLSDKLLNMPPFRFLHDIVSEIIKQTGFASGLYSEEELDSSLVKAKPAKMAYLDKLIMVVGKSLNTLVDARPAKIVAGLEAENTNRMLQLLALAAVEKPDSSRVVALIYRSDGDGGGLKRRSSTGSTSGAAGGDRGQESQGDLLLQPQHRRASSSMLDIEASKAGRRDSQDSSAATRQDVAEEKSSSNVATAAAADSRDHGKGNGNGGDDASNAKDSEDKAEAIGVGEGPVRSMRPTTARRRPPAVKDNTKQFGDRGRAQVPDEAAKAPPKSTSIMMDGDADKESDDDEVDGVSDPIGAGTLGVGGGGAKGEGGHTAMVADILKEKEKAEEMKAKEADAEAKGGQEEARSSEASGGGIRMGRLRGPGPSLSSSSPLTSSRENKSGVFKGSRGGGGGYGDTDVAKLKDSIQSLCQSTHPLGKCMDFVHEDLSLMSQEMERWRALYKVKAEALESERAASETFLQPFRSQLRDLEDQLKESSMKIDGVKAGISVNDRKINSLLKMVVTS